MEKQGQKKNPTYVFRYWDGNYYQGEEIKECGIKMIQEELKISQFGPQEMAQKFQRKKCSYMKQKKTQYIFREIKNQFRNLITDQ